MSSFTITATSGLRVIPGAVLDLRRPQRMLERSLMVTRRNWMVVFSGFFEPLFYLLSIRIGMSELVGDVTFSGGPIGYAEFVAPALMAASAMNGAVSARIQMYSSASVAVSTLTEPASLRLAIRKIGTLAFRARTARNSSVACARAALSSRPSVQSTRMQWMPASDTTVA